MPICLILTFIIKLKYANLMPIFRYDNKQGHNFQLFGLPTEGRADAFRSRDFNQDLYPSYVNIDADEPILIYVEASPNG